MNADLNYKKDLRLYWQGFTFALILTLPPFALVKWGGWPPLNILFVVGLLALIQMIVHFRYFLHIDLSKQKRDDLYLILFSVMLLVIMAGGTIWILWALALRMG